MLDGPPGHVTWMSKLEWQGMSKFNNRARKIYYIQDPTEKDPSGNDRVKVGGYFKKHENLELLTVFGAGHFVPTD